MKIIFLLLKNSRKNFFLAAISSFISGASSAGVIAVINYTIASLPDLPAWLLWLFIGLCLVLWIFRFISWVLITRLAQEIIYNLRLEMAQRILNCPLQNLETIGAPKLLATLTGDINTIATASIQLSVTIVNLAVLVGIFAYLCWLDPLLFLIVFGSTIGGYALYRFVQKQGVNDFQKSREIQDVLFGHFRSITEGTKELKLNRQKRNVFLDEELKLSAIQAKHYWIKGITVFAFAGSLGTILFFIPIGLILFVFPQINTVSTAIISSYALAVLYIISPITEITSALPQIAQANIALKKIDSLGISLAESFTEPAIIDENNFKSDWFSWELVNINHAYSSDLEEHQHDDCTRGGNLRVPHHQFTLDHINLKFNPGEIIFIVGGNGSGKSTLIKLITGLYIPDRGEVSFNNIPVSDHNREWYRQQFSVVFYDFYLFDRLLGIDKTRQSEIQDYLIQLEIEHKVTVKDGILSTTNLSQGQRKRLALLAAYLEDRPIYVFDEWASDQDPVFKEIFYKKLLPKLKSRGKTIIAVTHDDRYFTECDRIIKLDFGRVVEDRYSNKLNL